ncbi:(2Fe-2S)-binding protein [Falsiroseomonas oryzae]|uniref:(2Fe-2S)-binding protein n=1 Tax=Falsiroseomonas oryzae TaxID=2766473 RepID=UPI0022EB32FE|nr:(2Fe-2S)-binding protein [Roseomonas sp. MO-31]
MLDRIALTLSVNGEPREIRVAPMTTLLEALRTELALTGAKRGCNQGVCGACTVLLDGRPVRGCLTLAVAVGEREVTTVEGLAPPGQLGRVQEALEQVGAVQCGFCTPGIVLALEGLLRETPHPDEDALREALSGNLCRCSGYVKILEGARRAVEAAS